jgi:hypothetical protein
MRTNPIKIVLRLLSALALLSVSSPLPRLPN